jgi:hypothetical protein
MKRREGGGERGDIDRERGDERSLLQTLQSLLVMKSIDFYSPQTRATY